MTATEIQLLSATAAFVGTHLILSHPLRAPIVARTGEGPFLLLYSLVSLVTFAWMVLAARALPPETPWWVAPEPLWTLANPVMLVASVLLIGSLFGNPALPDPTHRIAVPAEAKGVFAITRHPMLWSFILWGIVHVGVLGSLSTVTIGGGMILLSLVGATGQDAKKAKLVGAPWRDWQARTAFIPFGGQISGRIGWGAAWPGLTAVLGGVVLLLVATAIHPYAGGPVVGPWRWVE